MTTKDLFNARLRIQLLEADAKRPKNYHRWRILEVRSKERHRSHRLLAVIRIGV